MRAFDRQTEGQTTDRQNSAALAITHGFPQKKDFAVVLENVHVLQFLLT